MKKKAKGIRLSENPLFKAEQLTKFRLLDPLPKKIARLKFETPEVRALADAIEECGVVFDLPGWIDSGVVGHIVSHSDKVIFWMAKNSNPADQSAWEKAGYRYVHLRQDQIRSWIERGILGSVVKDYFEAIRSGF